GTLRSQFQTPFPRRIATARDYLSEQRCTARRFAARQCSRNRRDDTVRNTKVLAVAFMGLGMLLGYTAASGKLNPFQRAGAGPPAPTTAADKPTASPEGQSGCCDGASKGQLLAQAEPRELAEARASASQKQPAGKRPNIVFIMGDDVGWFHIGAYHQRIMSGKTPTPARLGSQGMRFTDYYAEASCTAGRASFITGQIPLRTGLTTVGQAGADVGMPAQACTIATALKELGYATGQFGKNHLGDLNKYLPTLHGFDEVHGYLYHLDAMSDPFWYSFPSDPAFLQTYGPRNLVHCWATDTEDETVMPRWGKIGKQKVVDEGPLRPFKNMTADHQCWQQGPPGSKYDMETFD